MENSGEWTQKERADDDEFELKVYKFKDFKTFDFERSDDFVLSQEQFSKALYEMVPFIRPSVIQRIFQQKKDMNNKINRLAWQQTRDMFLTIKKMNEDLRENSMQLRKGKDGEYIGKEFTETLLSLYSRVSDNDVLILHLP